MFLLKSVLFDPAAAGAAFKFYNTASSAMDVKLNGVPYGFIYSDTSTFSSQKSVLFDTAYSREQAIRLLHYMRDGKYIDAKSYRVGYRLLAFSANGDVFGLFWMDCHLKTAPQCYSISKALPDINFRKSLPTSILHTLIWQLLIVILLALMAHHTRIVNPGEQ